MAPRPARRWLLRMAPPVLRWSVRSFGPIPYGKSTMMRTTSLLATALAAFALSVPAAANGTPVRVTINGVVEFNLINPPPLGNVNKDDLAKLSFLVYSGDFVNSASFPTRGYRIDKNSFSLVMGSTTMKLQNPFPAGETPYFVLRDNDPAVDGFMVSTNVDSPSGVPINQNGNFGAFRNNFYVTYGGSTLSSLDILGALGSYDFTGLSVFNWTVSDGPFDPLGLIFSDMLIEAVPAGPTVYCTGKLNTQGCTPSMSSDAGLPLLSSGPWNVYTDNLINNSVGIYIWGYAQGSMPFQNGTMCIGGPLTRTPGQGSGGNPPPADCSGTMSLDLTTTIPASVVPAIVTVQAWQRDVTDPFGSGLSNGIEVLVCP